MERNNDSHESDTGKEPTTVNYMLAPTDSAQRDTSNFVCHFLIPSTEVNKSLNICKYHTNRILI